MPKTDPMTSEEFALRLQDFAKGVDIPKCKTTAQAIRWYEETCRDERDEWAKLITERDAQRDCAVLEQAAERVCENYCSGLCYRTERLSCQIYKAILSPIADEKEKDK